MADIIAAKQEPMVKVQVVRSVWNKDGVRIDPGQTIEVSQSAAMDGIESGIYETVKSKKS